MRKNAKKVLEAFANGKAAQGDSKATIHTDGSTVYSYAMPIACRTPDGFFVVEYDQGPSRTTKSQIRACQVFLAGNHQECSRIISSPMIDGSPFPAFDSAS